MGRKLYYYHKDGGVELDFIIRYKSKCIPIECKATTGNAKSMRTVLKLPEKYHAANGLKFWGAIRMRSYFEVKMSIISEILKKSPKAFAPGE